jgi:hypothetical protein
MERGGDWELWHRFMAGGGWRRFSYVPVPTTLHFVASRRRGSESRRKALWYLVRRWEGSVDPVCQVDLRHAANEQEAVWNAMRGPGEWPRAIRRAVQVDLDRRSANAFLPSHLLHSAAQLIRRIGVS